MTDASHAARVTLLALACLASTGGCSSSDGTDGEEETRGACASACATACDRMVFECREGGDAADARACAAWCELSYSTAPTRMAACTDCLASAPCDDARCDEPCEVFDRGFGLPATGEGEPIGCDLPRGEACEELCRQTEACNWQEGEAMCLYYCSYVADPVGCLSCLEGAGTCPGTAGAPVWSAPACEEACRIRWE